MVAPELSWIDPQALSGVLQQAQRARAGAGAGQHAQQAQQEAQHVLQPGLDIAALEAIGQASTNTSSSGGGLQASPTLPGAAVGPEAQPGQREAPTAGRPPPTADAKQQNGTGGSTSGSVHSGNAAPSAEWAAHLRGHSSPTPEGSAASAGSASSGATRTLPAAATAAAAAAAERVKAAAAAAPATPAPALQSKRPAKARWRQEGRPLTAKLPPPEVLPASPDTCAQVGPALHIRSRFSTPADIKHYA